jgi:cytochrome c2
MYLIPLSRLRIGGLLALSSLAACSDASNAPVPSESARRGEVVFAQNCAHCHIVQSGKWKDAPSLQNILGRKAGSTSFPYSAAFRQADFVWSRETLDRFLADPRRVVPGNQMAFFGMPDAGARSDLTAYLAMMSPSSSKP